MTNVDWFNSIPGTDEQKDLLVRRIVNCGFCHDFGRVARSTYTADEFVFVIARMAMRVDRSFRLRTCASS